MIYWFIHFSAHPFLTLVSAFPEELTVFLLNLKDGLFLSESWCPNTFGKIVQIRRWDAAGEQKHNISGTVLTLSFTLYTSDRIWVWICQITFNHWTNCTVIKILWLDLSFTASQGILIIPKEWRRILNHYYFVDFCKAFFPLCLNNNNKKSSSNDTFTLVVLAFPVNYKV